MDLKINNNPEPEIAVRIYPDGRVEPNPKEGLGFKLRIQVGFLVMRLARKYLFTEDYWHHLNHLWNVPTAPTSDKKP